MISPRFCAAAVVAASLLFGVAGCGSGGDSSPSPAPSASVDVPVTTRSTYGPLEFTQTASKTAYNKGEAVLMTFTVKNISSEAVQIQGNITKIGSSYQKIVQNGQVISSQNGGGTPALGFTLPAGQVITGTESWSQRDDQLRQVPSGTYLFYVRLSAVGVDQDAIGVTKADQVLGPEPIQITVQ